MMYRFWIALSLIASVLLAGCSNAKPLPLPERADMEHEGPGMFELIRQHEFFKKSETADKNSTPDVAEKESSNYQAFKEYQTQHEAEQYKAWKEAEQQKEHEQANN